MLNVVLCPINPQIIGVAFELLLNPPVCHSMMVYSSSWQCTVAGGHLVVEPNCGAAWYSVRHAARYCTRRGAEVRVIIRRRHLPCILLIKLSHLRDGRALLLYRWLHYALVQYWTSIEAVLSTYLPHCNISSEWEVQQDQGSCTIKLMSPLQASALTSNQHLIAAQQIPLSLEMSSKSRSLRARERRPSTKTCHKISTPMLIKQHQAQAVQ